MKQKWTRMQGLLAVFFVMVLLGAAGASDAGTLPAGEVMFRVTCGLAGLAACAAGIIMR